MRTRSVVIVSVLLTIVLFACKKEAPIGKWNDIIQLSGKEFNFKPAGDSVLIVAKGKWWGIESVRLDTNQININSSITDACSFIYIDSNIKMISKSCDTLFVKMNTNHTSTDRTLLIGLWAGDYHNQIKIVQSKK